MIQGTMPVAGGQRPLGLPQLPAAFELLGELGAGGEAVGRIGGQAAANRLLERLAGAGDDLACLRRLAAALVGERAEAVDHAGVRIDT